MGCTLTFSPDGLLLRSDGVLHGIEADMDTMPDTVLTLAVVAAFADGATAHHQCRQSAREGMRQAQRCRHGAWAAWCGCHGRAGLDRDKALRHALTPARNHTYDDHRVAMAFSIAGLVGAGVEIEDPACVAKSFPEFWDELARFSAHHMARAA